MGAFDLPGGDIPGATQFLVQVPKQIQIQIQIQIQKQIQN